MWTRAIIVGIAAGLAAEIEIDAAACRSQAEAVVRLDFDCEILAIPSAGAFEALPPGLAPILRGLSCRLPLKFAKSEVYGTWITDDAVRLPTLEVTCGHANAATPLIVRVAIACTKSEEAWTCEPGILGIAGAGFLGTALAAWINGPSGVWDMLEQELSRRD
jgi:hypothetical protein